MRIIYFIILNFLLFFIIYGESNEKYEKAIVIEIGEKIEAKEYEKDMVNYYEKIKIKIKTGKYKNKIFIISNPNFVEKKFNYKIKKNDKVQVIINEDTINIVSIDNRNNMLMLLIIFLSIILFLGKIKGLKAIIALFFSLIMIIYFFIPFILKGYEPIIIALIMLCIISFVSIILIMGINKKSLSALIGLLGGIFFSGTISYIFISLMRISGYYSMEILNYADILGDIDMFQLITAGIIIGSTGAIMDVSVSISSSLSEIKLHNNSIDKKQLFQSGMNIGKDIIGTMVNTLILAYIGSSIVDILLFNIQKVDYPLIRVFNFEFVIVEFVRAVCGSIGILVSVPITSYFSSKFLTK